MFLEKKYLFIKSENLLEPKAIKARNRESWVTVTAHSGTSAALRSPQERLNTREKLDRIESGGIRAFGA